MIAHFIELVAKVRGQRTVDVYTVFISSALGSDREMIALDIATDGFLGCTCPPPARHTHYEFGTTSVFDYRDAIHVFHAIGSTRRIFFRGKERVYPIRNRIRVTP